MSVPLDEFKARQRATWASGDYVTMSERIADVGERVAARAGIEPGATVLDVACGAGNAALAAARARGRVTGLDLVPELLDAGRAKAESEGLEVAWVEGDAEALPLADGSFDRVLSTFGHMFAPRHRTTADEMIRVCRAGGAIVTATWAADGVFGAMTEASAAFMPPPPDFAGSPLLWGTEEYVREVFGETATAIEIERHANWIEEESVERFADQFMDRFPVMVTARAMLGDRFPELRERIVQVWRDRNEADDGTFRMRQEYLLSVVRL